MIFSIIGVAGSWKFICHCSGASKVLIFVEVKKKKALIVCGTVKLTCCG